MTSLSARRQLSSDDLSYLAIGCTILSAGGGGDPRVGELMARHALSQVGSIDLVDLDELPADGLVVSVGMIGAPTVMVEKMPNGRESVVLREMLEARLGAEIVAFMPVEMGGINGILPIAWAANAGLPLVDGDWMGRAFPELQMCTPHLYDIPAWPLVVVDERLQGIMFEPRDNFWAERLARTAVSALGGCACFGAYPMSVEAARKPLIARTLTKAIEIGRSVSDAPEDPFDSLAEVIDVDEIMVGKVTDIERRTEAGFVRGSAFIEGTGKDTGRVLRIEFQNENLVVFEDGEVLATVPDIITLLDVHTSHGIVTEHVRYGQRVRVAVFPSPDQWMTPEGLAVVGPKAFGYDVEFESMKERRAKKA